MKQIKITSLVQQTEDMINQFKKIEQREWGIEGTMIELSKQVGDLSKHIMVQEKYYIKSRETEPEYITTKKEIADELFDIWFCLIRISQYYKIDLKKSINDITKKELNDFKLGKIK